MNAPTVTAPAASCPSSFITPDKPTWELYSRCIHCGLCVNFCPTYRVLGLEADSPRGRIYQIVQADAGRLPLGPSFVLHLDRCLGCRACESACPSGVRYGRLLEQARVEIEHAYPRPWLERKLRAYFYGKVLTSENRLARFAKLLRWYQRTGVQELVRESGILRALGLEHLEALAPRIDDRFFFSDLGQTFAPSGPVRARVAFFAGCIANVAFADLNRATIRVLNANGVLVHVPAGQGCCGALHAHAGRLDDARALARRNLDALRGLDFDAIINNAGGCGAMLKEYGDLLADDMQYADEARAFAARVRDISEFLVQIEPAPFVRKLQARVTYQDSCHLAHAQGVRSAPRQLLAAVCAEFVEMPRADFCCGSAGTYNVTQNALSMQILDAKMDDIGSTGADTITSANTGCMIQLRAGVARRGLRMKVKHVVELLDEAYRKVRSND